jgi:hypothetical protein
MVVHRIDEKRNQGTAAPGRADSLFFLGALGNFLLGMLALLGYIDLESAGERLCHRPGRRRPGEEWLLPPGDFISLSWQT